MHTCDERLAMAKKDKKRQLPKRRWIKLLALLILSVGGWWLWENNREIQAQLLSYIENGDILTLESKYTPEQIMDDHQQELLGNAKRSYQDAVLKYYPYLLLEVKYTADKTSREGVILWGMEDGEMVLNTNTWETSHGFKDCLECDANRTDFKIINVLASHQGSFSIEGLQQELHLEQDTLEPWIESARRKHLIVQNGNILQLHFENPKIRVNPQTQITQNLVSKPTASTQKVIKKYSKNQIMKVAKAAFGNDFTIRGDKEVYLPVYSLSVLNSDGSIHTSDWNALNGQRIIPNYLSKI